MQLLLANISVWRTAMLFLWFLSHVYAAIELEDLSEVSGMPVAQLNEPENMKNGFYGIVSPKQGSFGRAMFCDDDQRSQYKFFTEDGLKYVACCGPDEHLSGSITHGLSCCGAGRERTGSPAQGYGCCPKGNIYEGGKCKTPKDLCRDGKHMVDGKCLCPAGTIEDKNGNCTVPTPLSAGTDRPPGTFLDSSGQCVSKSCDSGIVTGNIPNAFSLHRKANVRIR